MLRWLTNLKVAWYAIYYSALYGVNRSVVFGLLRAEGWNPARPTYEPNVPPIKEGWDYSWGPMQILPGTAEWMGYRGPPEALHNPAIGMRYGTIYLRKQLRRYDGNVCKALSAYNAGRCIQGNEVYVTRAIPECAGYRCGNDGASS